MRLLILAACCTLAAAAAETVSGEWKIERNAGGNASQQICTFSQKDAELTGDCTVSGGTGGTVPLTGKVEGKNITWTYKSDSAGGPVTVVYKGAIEAEGKMSGSVTAIEFSIEGEFTARRVK